MVHSVIRLCVAILCIVLNNYVTYITVTSHSAVVIIILLIRKIIACTMSIVQ